MGSGESKDAEETKGKPKQVYPTRSGYAHPGTDPQVKTRMCSGASAWSYTPKPDPVVEGASVIKGELRRTFGDRGFNNGEFTTPASVAVDKDGTIFVGDTAHHTVQVFKPDGSFIRRFGAAVVATPDEAMNGPLGLALARDKSGALAVVVVDHHHDRVIVYNAEGKVLRTLGSSGEEKGQFKRPSDVAVDGNGNLYVLDERRVQVFSLDGLLLRGWGIATGDVSLRGAQGIHVGRDRVYVCSTEDHCIQVFTLEGVFVLKIGSGVAGAGDDEFNGPLRAVVGPDGLLYVADHYNGRIKVHKATTGAFVSSFTLGTDLDVMSPSALAFAPDNALVVLDQRKQAVHQFI